MDGVDEVDKSLWHDKTQDEAHADHNGIGRGPHPDKEEWEGQWGKTNLGGAALFTFTFPRHFNYVVIERIWWKVFVQNKTVSKSKIIIMNGGSGLTRTFIDCLVSMQYRAKWLLVKEHQALRVLPHFFLTWRLILIIDNRHWHRLICVIVSSAGPDMA